MTSTSLFVLCISGCIHPTEPIDYPKPEYAAFAVDLQNGFQGDTVVVKVDNQILYERATTANLSNGFAFRLVPAISAGTHQIEVSIPSLAVQTDTTLLIVPDVLVVGINFDRSKSQLSLSVDTTWLTYGAGDTPCLDCPWNFRLTDFEPAWSPDGNTIAYVHGDTINGQTGIWLVDANGKNKRILYSNPGAYSPAWSPDGKWIAFSCNAQIYKIRVDGTVLAQLTSEGRNFFPALGPDGIWITYSESTCQGTNTCGIWLMKSDGTGQRFLSSFGSYPDWYPVGTDVLYLARAVTSTGQAIGDSLWLFDIQTNLKRFLVFLHGQNYDNRYVKCSHDGTRIAFTSEPYASFPQIWIMDSNGTNLKQLTRIQGYSCDWSPTGDWIVYTNSDTSFGGLWLIRNDGSQNHPLSY